MLWPRSGCPRLRGGCNVEPRAVLGSGAGLWPLRAFGEQLRAPSPQREESCPVLSPACHPLLEGPPLNRREDRGRRRQRRQSGIAPRPVPGWVTGSSRRAWVSGFLPSLPAPAEQRCRPHPSPPGLAAGGGEAAGVLGAPLSGQPRAACAGWIL